MKNKNGFTLVELIAVIALLAVILLLIVPNVVNILREGREDAFINQIQSLIRSSESQYGTNVAFKNKSHIFCSEKSVFEKNYGAFSFEGSNVLALVDAPVSNNYSISYLEHEYCSYLDLNLNAAKYIVELDNDGRVIFLGLQDKNYCYVSDNPTVDLSKDDFDKGYLYCTDEYCTCGRQNYYLPIGVTIPGE